MGKYSKLKTEERKELVRNLLKDFYLTNTKGFTYGYDKKEIKVMDGKKQGNLIRNHLKRIDYLDEKINYLLNKYPELENDKEIQELYEACDGFFSVTYSENIENHIKELKDKQYQYTEDFTFFLEGTNLAEINPTQKLTSFIELAEEKPNAEAYIAPENDKGYEKLISILKDNPSLIKYVEYNIEDLVFFDPSLEEIYQIYKQEKNNKKR